MLVMLRLLSEGRPLSSSELSLDDDVGDADADIGITGVGAVVDVDVAVGVGVDGADVGVTVTVAAPPSFPASFPPLSLSFSFSRFISLLAASLFITALYRTLLRKS